jgi:hypothetical protein
VEDATSGRLLGLAWIPLNGEKGYLLRFDQPRLDTLSKLLLEVHGTIPSDQPLQSAYLAQRLTDAKYQLPQEIVAALCAQLSVWIDPPTLPMIERSFGCILADFPRAKFVWPNGGG